MTGALIILAFLILVGCLLWVFDRRKPASQDERVTTEGPGEEENECCGRHLICEKTSLAPLSTDFEYFDDEELDRFSGRPEESFTGEEIEEFREVLLSMRPEEVPAWARSLQLRRVTIPAPLREEILLIASDLRFS